MLARHVVCVLTFCLCALLAPLAAPALAADPSAAGVEPPGSTSTSRAPEHRTTAPPAAAAVPSGATALPVRTSLPSRGAAFTSVVVRTAIGFLGQPFQWAGIGNRGFDCSGLVTRVFTAMGLPLPHSSFDQYRAGIAVPSWALRPGDLVFFRTYSPGPSHVGIYVGAERFIHASYSRGVIISSMDEAYYRYRYLGARRL